MIEILVAAIALAAQPVALVGYIMLGVWARSWLHAVGFAVAWALAMQLFVIVTGSFADPLAVAIQFGLRAAGAVVLTLAIYLLYRVLRGGGGAGPGRRGGGGGGDDRQQQRPTHLRRVK